VPTRHTHTSGTAYYTRGTYILDGVGSIRKWWETATVHAGCSTSPATDRFADSCSRMVFVPGAGREPSVVCSGTRPEPGRTDAATHIEPKEFL
jgi:hypothetical protein